MKSKRLLEVLERVESWPAQAQDEFAEIASDIEAGFQDQSYDPTPQELAGIERGLGDAADNRFASDEEIQAVFAKFRQQ
jgi:hypothetical protein